MKYMFNGSSDIECMHIRGVDRGISLSRPAPLPPPLISILPEQKFPLFLLPPYFSQLSSPLTSPAPQLPLPPNQLHLLLTLSAPHICKCMYNRECLYVLLHALTESKCRPDHELCHSVYNVHERGTDPGGGVYDLPFPSLAALSHGHTQSTPSISWSGCVRERRVFLQESCSTHP